jgi:ribokinase
MGASPIGVLVVGSLNVDLVVRAPRQPRAGETLIGDGFATDQGGKGANQAVAAARMGVQVAMVGRVGDDDHGRRMRSALEREGIDTTAVSTDDTLPTGVAAILVAHDGENSIVVVPGANHALGLQHIDAAAAQLTKARVVVAQLEVPQAAVFHALRLARSAGAVTLLNAAPAAVLAPELLQTVQWLVVNEGEAAALLGTPVVEMSQARAAARALLAWGPVDVVVTVGARGLVHANAAGVTHHAANAVKAVDTTGAGDTFVGVLAASLAQGLPADEALRRGQAAAAIAVTRHGAQSAMPSADEVAARLAGSSPSTR